MVVGIRSVDTPNSTVAIPVCACCRRAPNPNSRRFSSAMAKEQPVEEARKKRRAEVPPEVVAPADSESDEGESEEDDDESVLKDEFEGLSDVDSDESLDSVLKSENESDDDDEEMGDGGTMKTFVEQVVANPKMLEMGYTTSEGDSMEGSRSRSEEDLRDIGSARRLDDDDTAESAWKEAAGTSSSSAPEDEGKSAGAASGSGGDGAEVRVLDDGEKSGDDAVEMEEEEEGEEEDEDEDEEDENEEDEEEDERLGAEEGQSEGEPSASEGGSDSDRGTEGGKTQSSSYSRAFSKILQSKAAKESDTGPVLAARQTLVARKLEEDAGETKDNKGTRIEKKELREKAHLYPQSFTDTKEKDLVKLATRGVVKLFNAVSKAQKVQASADGRDARVVAKESKAAFLAEVKGSGTSAAVGNKRRLPSSSEPPFKFGTSESQNQSTSRWSVVKDDFMIGKQKLKDWDKDEEMGDVAGEQMTNGIDDDSD